MPTTLLTASGPSSSPPRLGGSAEPQPARRLAVAVLAGTAVMFVVVAYPYTHLPFAGEHGVESYGAWRFSEGDVIYRDYFTFDGPGIYLLHRVAHGVFGWDVTGLRRFDLAWFGAILLALYAVAAPMLGPLGGALTVLFAVPAYFGLGYRATAQRDGFAFLPLLLALLVARGWGVSNRRDVLLSAAIGALGSIAFSLKPPLGLLPGLLLLVPGRLPDSRIRGVTLRAAGMAGGFLLASAPWLGYFAVHDALPQAYECLVVFNMRYTAERYPLVVQFAHALRATPALPWTALGVIGCALFGWCDARWRGPALVTVGLAAVVLAQGKLLDYHAVPLELMLCLWSAAVVVWTARRGADIRGGRLAAALLAGGLLVMGVRQLISAQYAEIWQYRLTHGEPLAQREDIRLAEFLGERTPRDETILIWGIESPGIINFIARRASPTRFLSAYPFALRGPSDDRERRWRREYMDAVRARPPRWVVVMGNDAFPGINNLDSRASFARFAELREFVERDYQPAGSLQGRFSYQLYVRREGYSAAPMTP